MWKCDTSLDILQDMDQFNKVLAAFLLLVVAVGISLFIFSRLGILSRILPSTKSTTSTTTTLAPQSPTPTQTPTPSPQTNQPGILGWFSQLVKPKVTPTLSPAPNPILETQKPSKPQSPNPTKQPTQITAYPTGVIAQTQDKTANPPITNPTQTTNPNITIIPYGSTSVATYPASGIEIMFIPTVFSFALFGLLLKYKARL